MSIRSFVSSTACGFCGILVGLVLAPAAVGQTTITAPYNPDSDADSVIAILDLMSVLSIYGDAFEPAPIMIDGITLQEYLTVLEQGAGCVVGCQDEAACNYDSTATVGIACTCDYLSCLGCTDSGAQNYDPQASFDDGSCIYGPTECGGVNSIVYHGYEYELVAVGSQCWFAENLRNSHYANGDPIPGNLSQTDWITTNSGAQTIYEVGNAADNFDNYGLLYNWYAVDDARGLCPSGWHVPTDEEWMTLELALGMTSSEANAFGPRGSDQGVQLKSSPEDLPPWNGSNTSGFSALAGGWRNNSNGSFAVEGLYGYWWSSTIVGSSSAYFRSLGSGSDGVSRANYGLRFGFSVRCLRD